jgi:transcriptional regulator with XRE-family HTH domain
MGIREVLALNLRRRQALGLSQEELAHRADIDRTYVSALVRSVYAAGIDVLDRLARALGMEGGRPALATDIHPGALGPRQVKLRGRTSSSRVGKSCEPRASLPRTPRRISVTSLPRSPARSSCLARAETYG